MVVSHAWSEMVCTCAARLPDMLLRPDKEDRTEPARLTLPEWLLRVLRGLALVLRGLMLMPSSLSAMPALGWLAASMPKSCNTQRILEYQAEECERDRETSHYASLMVLVWSWCRVTEGSMYPEWSIQRWQWRLVYEDLQKDWATQGWCQLLYQMWSYPERLRSGLCNRWLKTQIVLGVMLCCKNAKCRATLDIMSSAPNEMRPVQLCMWLMQQQVSWVCRIFCSRQTSLKSPPGDVPWAWPCWYPVSALGRCPRQPLLQGPWTCRQQPGWSQQVVDAALQTLCSSSV